MQMQNLSMTKVLGYRIWNVVDLGSDKSFLAWAFQEALRIPRESGQNLVTDLEKINLQLRMCRSFM